MDAAGAQGRLWRWAERIMGEPDTPTGVQPQQREGQQSRNPVLGGRTGADDDHLVLNDDFIIDIYDDKQHNLVVHDIKQHDLHLYLHQYNDIDPPGFHHHHGTEDQYDILYHNKPCYIDHYYAVGDDLYRPRQHNHDD